MLASSAKWSGSTNSPSWLASHVWGSVVTACVGSSETRNKSSDVTVTRAKGGSREEGWLPALDPSTGAGEVW